MCKATNWRGSCQRPASTKIPLTKVVAWWSENSKEEEDRRKNSKTKNTGQYQEGFRWILKYCAFNFPYTFIPHRRKKTKDCLNRAHRTARTVTCFSTLRHQVISIPLFRQWTHPRPKVSWRQPHPGSNLLFQKKKQKYAWVSWSLVRVVGIYPCGQSY